MNSKTLTVLILVLAILTAWYALKKDAPSETSLEQAPSSELDTQYSVEQAAKDEYQHLEQNAQQLDEQEPVELENRSARTEQKQSAPDSSQAAPVLPDYGLIEPPQQAEPSFELEAYQPVFDQAELNSTELLQYAAEFSQQVTDESWASEQEQALYQKLLIESQDQSLQIDSIECRETLCQVVGEVRESSSLETLLQKSASLDLESVASESVTLESTDTVRFITILESNR